MGRHSAVGTVGRRPAADNRRLHALLGLGYLLSYWYVYISYISVRWSYMGFPYYPMTPWQIAFAALGVMAVAFSLPTRLRGPSSIFLWLLFAFVYVPTMAQTYMLAEREANVYNIPLAALTIVMIVACWICGRVSSSAAQPGRSTPVEMVPHQGLAYGFVVLAMVLSGLQLFYYRDILTFSDFTSSSDIYAQRFAAADVTGGVIGYVRTYYSTVIAPPVIALGLLSRRYRWFIVPGLACFVISYMIDGSKISLIIPVAMLGIYGVVRWARSGVLVMTGALGALTFICGLLTGQSAALRYFADLILVRSIAIPGQQFALYYDLFGTRGYTWWSNVKGINLFVPPPATFAADPRWPMLGKIVGEEYGGIASQNNSNANPFAGEGVAAAGALGVVVIGLVLAAYLRLLDQTASSLHRTFVLLVSVPVAMALTNIHLSTMLMSFGGAFWVAAFIVMSRLETVDRLRAMRAA